MDPSTSLFRSDSFGHGVRLHHRRTKAFKTITARIVFQADLDEGAAARAMIPRLLARGTERFPSLVSLQTELDRLYGASFGGEARKIGERQIVQFRSDWVSDRIAGEKLTAAMGTFIEQAIQTPAPWTVAIFEQERKILLDEARAVYDDKGRYARQRMLEIMCRHEAYARPAIGHEREIEALTLEDVARAYCELLDRAPIEIFVVGDLSWAAAQRFARLLSLHRDHALQRLKRPMRVGASRVRTVKEVQDVGQAKLDMGFRTTLRLSSRQYPALVLANALFGGSAIGKLFKEVREKASLCYAISSNVERSKGLVLVQAGIDPANYAKARRMILRQLVALQDGDIPGESLDQARAIVLSGLKSMQDSAAAVIEFALERVLANRPPDLDGLYDGIARVKAKSIAAAARTIELDTVFLLTNEGASS